MLTVDLYLLSALLDTPGKTATEAARVGGLVRSLSVPPEGPIRHRRSDHRRVPGAGNYARTGSRMAKRFGGAVRRTLRSAGHHKLLQFVLIKHPPPCDFVSRQFSALDQPVYGRSTDAQVRHGFVHGEEVAYAFWFWLFHKPFTLPNGSRNLPPDGHRVSYRIGPTDVYPIIRKSQLTDERSSRTSACRSELGSRPFRVGSDRCTVPLLATNAAVCGKSASAPCHTAFKGRADLSRALIQVGLAQRYDCSRGTSGIE